MSTRSTSYRLRAASPQPVKGECPSTIDPNPPTIGFVLQTFKAEKITTDVCEDQTELLCSNDMLGLGGLFISASYSAQRFLDPDTGEIVFQATETRRPQFIDETEVPGIGVLL
jgi:hypothetical protein